MQNWKRKMWFDETGLPWENPSPNIRNLYQATLYPGIGLFERLNVANKKGLERPFEQIGAPWINSAELIEELRNRKIKGVKYIPVRFTPKEHKYKDQQCEGVFFNIIDRDNFQPVKFGIHLLQALYKLYPQNLEIDKLWHITRSEKLIADLKNLTPVDEIIKSWKADLLQFKNRREKFLLY